MEEQEVVGLHMGDGEILPLILLGDLGCKRGLLIGETGHETFLIRKSLKICTKSEHVYFFEKNIYVHLLYSQSRYNETT